MNAAIVALLILYIVFSLVVSICVFCELKKPVTIKLLFLCLFIGFTWWVFDFKIDM